MSLQFNNRMVHECKGAALSVLVLLVINRGGVSQQFLERNSGYTDKPVSQALAYLQENGIVIRTSAGWQIAAGATIPLTYNEPECLPAGNSDTNCQGRNNSDPIIIIKQDSIKLIKEDLNNKNSRNNSDSDKTDPDLSAIWTELAQMSVKRNSRTEELVRLPHITRDYVHAWRLQFVFENHGSSSWTGLFIKTLERGEEAPKLNKLDHLDCCKCSECVKMRSKELWGGGEEHEDD